MTTRKPPSAAIETHALHDIDGERLRQVEAGHNHAADNGHAADDWQELRRKYERQIAAMGPAARRAALVKMAALCVAEIEAIDRTAA